MTALFDFRQTFLRRHLVRELNRTDEVLALEELNKIQDAPRLTLRDFFYGGLPEAERLYIPVRVLPLGDEVRGLPSRYFAKRPPKDRAIPTFDLTYALDALRECNIPGGIYLRSRSGAGKTAAGLAAQCDCFHGPGPQGVLTHTGPRLAGFLPCRLRPGAAFKRLRERFAHFTDPEKRDAWLDGQVRTVGSGLVENMLLATADLAGKGRKRLLRQWLKFGPPLLLFVDLNALGDLERRLSAAALVKFQEESAEAGHRVVVTYRSATLDGVHTTLSGCRLLHGFDLEPLSPWQAAEYLRSYRHLAARRSGTSVSEAELDEQAQALHKLIDDHGTSDESLVSTPLLMHLVTYIEGQELRNVRTLSDLYDRVVHHFFEHDFRRTLPEEAPRLFTDQSKGSPEGHFITAMCRPALAILAGGANNTRLTGNGPTKAADLLNLLWNHPEVSRLWNGGPKWHPSTEWWLKDSPYYGAKAVPFDPAHQKELFQRTLLHQDGDSFRFLHDSFIYYFAAVALRGYRHAIWNNGLNQIESQSHPWYEQTAARLHESPRVWVSAAEFLGGMLQPQAMTDLAFRMLIAAPKDSWPTVLIRLLDGRRRTEPEDAVIAGIDYALHHKEGMVERVPAALRTEVYHYLRDGGRRADCRDFAERLEKAGGCAWVYSLKPTWWPAPLMRDPTLEANCVGLMPDGRVLAGSHDGRVLLWDPIRRHVRTLIRHDVRVFCLAVSADGATVVSGGGDGMVRRWTRQGGEDRTPLIIHKDVVWAVAASGDGGAVVSGWRDGKVRRWTREGGEDRTPLITHMENVRAVAISADGATVVSGGGDRVVRRWTWHSGEEHTPLISHRGRVNAVAMTGDGQIVISGGSDFAIRRWTRQGGEDRRPLMANVAIVHCVALSGDGATIVAGGEDMVVQRWTAAGGVDLTPIIAHEGYVRGVAISSDGAIVVSGSEDRTVRRWPTQGGDKSQPPVGYLAAVRAAYRRGVRSVAISGDGETVVFSRDDDDVVRRWTRESGEESTPLITHESTVWAVAISGDGATVVSAGSDDRVRCWTREGGEESTPLITYDHPMTTLAISRDGATVVSGGFTIPVWRRKSQGGVERRVLLPAPSKYAGAVALNADGTIIVSGDSDGVVRRRTRLGVEECTQLITHKGTYSWINEGKGSVSALAVNGNGETVVSGGSDNAVRRWTHQDGEELTPLITHEDKVIGVALTSDGTVVVSGGDWTIRCHSEGQGVVCAFLFNSSVTCLAFTDRVGRIAVGLRSDEVAILDLRNFPPDSPA